MKEYLKVLLLTLEDERNLGDTVIADCTKYIIKSILEKKDIEYNLISIDFKKVCKDQICNSDIIIFSGGGLISDKYQRLIKRIDEITELADQMNKTVIFNAVGVEGYGNSLEYRTLKNIINRNCVRFISTRDDIDLLNEKYILNPIHTKSERVGDSALWSKEVYNISKDESSKIIGLGVIRSGIFRDNNIDFNEESQLKFWSDIINKLESEGKEWVIFTNGLHRDYNFAIKILEYMGRNNCIEEKILPRPIEAKELVKNISNFKGVIASRLHANIIAYALGVPSIGIVWNPKLKWFGKITGNPNRFFDTKDCKSDDIIRELYKAIDEGYDKEFFKQYKKTTYQSLDGILGKYLDEIN